MWKEEEEEKQNPTQNKREVPPVGDDLTINDQVGEGGILCCITNRVRKRH